MTKKIRRHLSGTNKAERRFAETGDGVKVPINRAVVTAYYIADHSGNWPERDVVRVDADVASHGEGDTVYLEEMRAGHGMGEKEEYRIAETRTIVRRFDSRFGQVVRCVLLKGVAFADEVGSWNADDADNLEEGQS